MNNNFGKIDPALVESFKEKYNQDANSFAESCDDTLDFARSSECMPIVRAAYRDAKNGVRAQRIVDTHMVEYYSTGCDYDWPRGLETIEQAVDYAKRFNGI